MLVFLAEFLYASPMIETIKIDDQVFTRDGGQEIGAVRSIDPVHHTILVYIENAGDFTIGAAGIRAVHAGKVILDTTNLSSSVKQAVARAHSGEDTDR